MVRSLAAIVLCFMLLTPLPAGAEVLEHVLPNGLKVLIAEDHKAPLAVFQVWYRVGAMDDGFGNTGASHLLEHMMFKGTKKYASKVLSKTVMKNGGIDNAFTSKDYTAYYQVLPSDRIGLSMDFESDRMRNLLLLEGDVEDERQVVMEERRMRYEDDPQSSLYENVIAAAYKVHPYHWPVIGWMSDLKGIGREDLLAHYRTFYAPENAVIVLVGDIDAKAALASIEKHFGGIPRSGREIPRSAAVEPPQQGERRVYLRREAELPYILAVYHVPVYPHPDAYALDVLATILSGGKSGSLYRSLVYEKKLAQSAFADGSGVSRAPDVFYLGGTAAPGVDTAELERALFAEVDALAATAPTEFELQKAKNQIAASYVMSQDSIQSQATLLGQLEMTVGWREKDEYLARMEAVTAEDVRRVAGEHLVPDNRTVGVLVPKENDR